MANIKKHLDNIKGALFGKDVRSSIHDGIDAINKEVESTTGRQEHLETTFDQLTINAGNSNAEIVDARVGENGKSYAKLGDRLDSVDSQLEHIVNKIEVSILDFYSGEASYSIALQKAFDFAKEVFTDKGEIITIKVPSGNYKIDNNISVSNSTFNLIMDGYFIVKQGIGKAISLSNCTNCELKLNVAGDAHSIDNFIYSDKLSSVNGIDVALHLENCQYTNLSFKAKRFFGRGIEVENGGTNNWGNLYGDLVGQMLYVDSGSGFGSIGHIWATEYVGSVFKATDLTIHYYENMVLPTPKKESVIFRNCNSLWITQLLIGNNSKDYMLKIIECTNVTANNIYISGNSVNPEESTAGVYIYLSHSLDLTINTSNIKGKSLDINGLKSSNIKLLDLYGEDLGHIYPLENYEVSECNFDITYRLLKGKGIEIGKSDNPNVNISLKIKGNRTADNISNDVIVNGASRVVVDNKSIIYNGKADINNNITNMTENAIFDNTCLKQFKSYISSYITPKVALSGFELSNNVNNKLSIFNNHVVGVLSLTKTSTETINITNGTIIATIPREFFNSLGNFITGVVRSADSYNTIPFILEVTSSEVQVKILQDVTDVRSMNINIIYSK